MGKVVLVGAALALGLTGAADAQRMVQHGPGAGYPPPAPDVRYPPLPPAPVQPIPGARWGGKVEGRWWGGVDAPGGWAAYRAPQRGLRLPSYWLAPRFYVSDWSSYGFPAPPPGYYWTRYYDDAVLIDDRGEVYDTVGGVDWDRYEAGAYADDRARRDRNGVAGAVAGAVVGGVAGNVIAGRGDRLGATLIGAGVGAATGYALGSRAEARRGPPPPPGAGYRVPPPPPPYEERVEHRMYDMGPGYPPPVDRWSSSDGRTTVTVTTGGTAPVIYAPPAYGYGGVTTVTVQTAPAVTTTTEIVEDSVTWTRPIARKAYRKRVWRPAGKLCRCR